MTEMPTPPGALGVAASSSQMLGYLGALDAWIRERRSELDSIDAKIIQSNRQAELNSDITLAMTIWQSIQRKQTELLRTWDSGRVTKVELEKISSLIWGRLDTSQQPGSAFSSMVVSLPEAGQLCDALVASLRGKLNTDPGVEDQMARLRTLRATAERIRDQLALEPVSLRSSGAARLQTILARLDEAEEKRGRGADIGGMLGLLESDAAIMERDLIVGSAQRREAISLLERVRQTRARLESEQLSLQATQAQAQATVWPSSVAALPSLESLGPIPNTRESLQEYDRALAALSPLIAARQREYNNLIGQTSQAEALLRSLLERATANGLAEDSSLAALHEAANSVLERKPTVVPTLKHAIAAYQSQLDYLVSNRGQR
ncbi:MAG: hypothetical protein LBK28_01270 [Propionibacteriaceae bacterium]|jgi:hypothetical protein|nr:hypothetical protein [Propionibacteriaceae bacterium]